MQAGITGLRHYGWLIRSRLPLILLGVIICTGATFTACKIIPPVYQATGSIFVNGTGATDSSSIVANQNLAQSYSLLITSTDVLNAASQKLPHISVEQLKQAVTAAPQANTAMIQIQAQANNPALAANIVNKVSNAFVAYQVTKQTALLQNSLNQITQNLTVAKSNMDAATAQLAVLQKNQAPAAAIQQQNQIINIDQASYNTLQTNYQANFYLLRMQKNQINSSLNIIAANPPAIPISPKTTLSTGLAAALSFVLLLVLVLLLDWADTTVKTPEDVAQLAGLEPLGSVPVSRYPNLFNASIDMSTVNNEDIQQAFVAISTNFDILAQGRGTIQFTGLRASTGTSTMAANVAISLAMSGKRVLLVDANLRRPALHIFFNRVNEQGLSNRLNDAYAFQEQRPDLVRSWLNLWPTDIPNLWLLPAGPLAPHSASIVRAPALPLLMHALLRQNQPGGNGEGVDIIILDTPPLNEGASAIALAAISDGTVLVVGAGKDLAESLVKARTSFQRLRSPIVGVIINRKKSSHRSYFYVDYTQQNAWVVGNASAEIAMRTPSKQPSYEQIWEEAPQQAVTPAAPQIRASPPSLHGIQQPTAYLGGGRFAPTLGQTTPLEETNNQVRHM